MNQWLRTFPRLGRLADHVQTPKVETVIDPLHLNGLQVIGGSRIPMLMFGGRVEQGIERSGHSPACIAKTVVDLVGLPLFGVTRVDDSASPAAGVIASPVRPWPPRFGDAIVSATPRTGQWAFRSNIIWLTGGGSGRGSANAASRLLQIQS